MYYFKSKDKFLQIQTSPDQRKIVSGCVINELINQEGSTLRTGVFDSQGSYQAWAWTTDEGQFEVWRPTGQLKRLAILKVSGDIILKKVSNTSVTVLSLRDSHMSIDGGGVDFNLIE